MVGNKQTNNVVGMIYYEWSIIMEMGYGKGITKVQLCALYKTLCRVNCGRLFMFCMLEFCVV